MSSGWQPTTAFHKMLRLNKRIKAIYGGSSSGKTFNMCAILYQRAIDNPGETITVCSNTLANLKKGAIRDFKNVLLSTDAWDPAFWRTSDSTYEIKFKGGVSSIIEFIGLEDETKARGPRRNRLFIDEANRISYEVYKQLERRTDKEVILSWNPSSPFWYNDELMSNVDHDVLVLNFKDNEALNEMQLEYFQDLEKQSTRSDSAMNEWRVYGLGEWGKTRGACIDRYTIVDEIPDGYYLVGMGLDFGNNDPNAGVNLYKNDNNQWIADEILYKNKMEIDGISRAIGKYDVTVFADYAWPQTINELKKKGHRVLKCKKGPDSIKHGIDLINEVDIQVTARSKNLINEFQTYRYKEDKDGNQVDGKYEGPDHLVDALRYVLTKNAKRRKIKIY